jgi:hypothetical protein
MNICPERQLHSAGHKFRFFGLFAKTRWPATTVI